MGYYEATKILDGPQVIEADRVQEKGGTFAVTSTPENAEDAFFGYVESSVTNGVQTYLVDNPAHMPAHVKPFLIEGILSHPTSDQLLFDVRCVTVVENMSEEEKDTFEQRHGISLDPEKHALIVYDVNAKDWSPNTEY